MIKLTNLLLEVVNQPKVIFLAGPAGSGKSTISKQLIPNNFTSINIDDTYEELLKKSGIGLNQKNFTPDQLSQASKFMGQAQKITRDKLASQSKARKNLIIDGTGGAVKPLLKKKQELEALGYETFMIMIYVSPITSLERNKNRERSLMSGIVLRTWRDVNKNIDDFKKIFGNNFVLINNEPNESIKDFNLKLLEPYTVDSKAIGKVKTPEEEAKSQAEKEQLNKDIEQMVKKLPQFDSLETSKTKINQFING